MEKRNLQLEERNYAYIGIDFDNTVVSDLWPEIGISLGAEDILKELVFQGHKLILYTMRHGEALDKAVQWFASKGIDLFAVNENPDFIGDDWSRKPFCDFYIDDRNLGTPLAAFYDSPRSRVLSVVDWEAMAEILKKFNLIKNQGYEYNV